MIEALTAYVPEYLIDCASILLFALIFSKIMRWGIRRRLNKMDPESAESTGLRFLKNTLRFLIWVTASIAMILTIPQLRVVATTLFAGAGLLVAIIGFAAQAALGNIISGFFIVIFKPFRVGDVINVGAEYRGKVTDITLRHTTIRDFRNRRIIIPNSQVSLQTIVNENIADPNIRRWIQFKIGFSADVDQALVILQQEAEKHPYCLDHRTEDELKSSKPIVEVKVTEVGDYYFQLTAFVWTAGPSEAWELHNDLNYRIPRALKESGIDLAVPQQNVTLAQQTNTPNTSASHG